LVIEATILFVRKTMRGISKNHVFILKTLTKKKYFSKIFPKPHKGIDEKERKEKIRAKR